MYTIHVLQSVEGDNDVMMALPRATETRCMDACKQDNGYKKETHPYILLTSFCICKYMYMYTGCDPILTTYWIQQSTVKTKGVRRNVVASVSVVYSVYLSLASSTAISTLANIFHLSCVYSSTCTCKYSKRLLTELFSNTGKTTSTFAAFHQ